MDDLTRGAKVYFELPFDLPDGMVTLKNLITQSTVTLFVATVLIMIAAYAVTRKITKRPGRVQVLVEKVITMLYNLVEDTMGKHNARFAPYIGTLFLSSMVNTLLGMTNILRSASADLSVTAAWALVTTGMVWYNNIRNFGFKAWLKGFAEPIVVMTPMNIVSEIASPLSLAFRHFGNVAGGSVLTGLIYFALSAASSMLFSWLPFGLSEIPFLTAGIPAFLSIYFDLFSGFVQAFVFSLLTMVYVAGACPPPEEIPEDRRAILEARAAKKAKANKN